MENFPRYRSTLTAFALLLAGCAAGSVPQSGQHWRTTECCDLTALRSNAPPTKAQHQSGLAALRRAGDNPSPWNDHPNFSADVFRGISIVNALTWDVTHTQGHALDWDDLMRHGSKT